MPSDQLHLYDLVYTAVDSNCGKCKYYDAADLHGIPGEAPEQVFKKPNYKQPARRSKPRRQPATCYGPDTEPKMECGSGWMQQASVRLVLAMASLWYFVGICTSS